MTQTDYTGWIQKGRKAECRKTYQWREEGIQESEKEVENCKDRNTSG